MLIARCVLLEGAAQVVHLQLQHIVAVVIYCCPTHRAGAAALHGPLTGRRGVADRPAGGEAVGCSSVQDWRGNMAVRCKRQLTRVACQRGEKIYTRI